jgi:hypothetical protein
MNEWFIGAARMGSVALFSLSLAACAGAGPDRGDEDPAGSSDEALTGIVRACPFGPASVCSPDLNLRVRACGKRGQPKCAGSHPCGDGLAVSSAGICTSIFPNVFALNAKNGTLHLFPLDQAPTGGVGSKEAQYLPPYAGGGYIGTKYVPDAGRTLSWPDGSEINNVDHLWDPGGPQANAESLRDGVGPNQPLMSLPAIFNNNGPGTVQGSVTYFLYDWSSNADAWHCAQPPMMLAIQKQNDAGVWEDKAVTPIVAAKPTPYSYSSLTATVSATVDTVDSPAVRVQLRSGPDLCGHTVHVVLSGATLFGEQCFPDFTTGGCVP